MVQWVYKAIYSNVDVTSWLQSYIMNCALPPGGGTTITVQSPWMIDPVSIAKGDPWPNVQKQLTMLMGFPSTIGGGMQAYKYLNVQPQDNLNIPLQNPGATIGTVVWNLTGPCVAFPKIVSRHLKYDFAISI